MSKQNDRAEKMATKVADARKDVVERILHLMEQDGLSWMREWSIHSCTPYNVESGRRYNGGNRLYLMGLFDDPRWMTFNQARKIGFFPRKGETSKIVEYWKPRKAYKDADGNIIDSSADEIPEGAREFTWMQLAGVFHVFNAAQLADKDGNSYPEFATEEPAMVLDSELFEVADNLVMTSRCPIHENASNSAYYSPASDTITIPARTRFNSMESFIGTLTHEMIHSTGSSLGRGIRNRFGSSDYAFEELVAELGSLFCCLELGVQKSGELEADGNFQNQAAYLKSWMSNLKDNPDYLFKAATQADRACDFLMKRYGKIES